MGSKGCIETKRRDRKGIKKQEWQFSKGVLTFFRQVKKPQSPFCPEVKGVAVGIVTPG